MANVEVTRSQDHRSGVKGQCRLTVATADTASLTRSPLTWEAWEVFPVGSGAATVQSRLV